MPIEVMGTVKDLEIRLNLVNQIETHDDFSDRHDDFRLKVNPSPRTYGRLYARKNRPRVAGTHFYVFLMSDYHRIFPDPDDKSCSNPTPGLRFTTNYSRGRNFKRKTTRLPRSHRFT